FTASRVRQPWKTGCPPKASKTSTPSTPPWARRSRSSTGSARQLDKSAAHQQWGAVATPPTNPKPALNPTQTPPPDHLQLPNPHRRAPPPPAPPYKSIQSASQHQSANPTAPHWPCIRSSWPATSLPFHTPAGVL